MLTSMLAPNAAVTAALLHPPPHMELRKRRGGSKRSLTDPQHRKAPTPPMAFHVPSLPSAGGRRLRSSNGPALPPTAMGEGSAAAEEDDYYEYYAVEALPPPHLEEPVRVPVSSIWRTRRSSCCSRMRRTTRAIGWRT